MLSFLKIVACVLVGVALYPACFLGAFIFVNVKSVLPHGVDGPLQLRLFQSGIFSLILLGTILKKLRLYNVPGLLRIFGNGLPALCDSALLIQDKQFDDVPVRIYQPKNPATKKRKGIVYIHGGAGIFGGLDIMERPCRYFAKEADSVVVSVGYSLAPESPYPVQKAECLKAVLHFMKNADDYHVDAHRIIIAGDSLGACYATQMCVLLAKRTDVPQPYAQALLYPALQAMDFNLPSYQQNKRVPIMWRELVPYLCCLHLDRKFSVIPDVLKGCHVPEHFRGRKWVNADRIPEEFKVRGYEPQKPGPFKPKLYEEVKEVLDKNFSPLLADDATIRKLPRTCILTCEYDVLRDDGLLYKRRLEDNGVPVTLYNIENGTHGMAALFGYRFISMPSAEQMVKNMGDFFKSL